MSRRTSELLEKLREIGIPYHRRLGIKLEGGSGGEIFKWFLASYLFGARISEQIAMKTYKEFEKEGLLSPKAIIAAGWSRLVSVLDKGGYVRYDFSTAERLLEVCDFLLERYNGNLNLLHAEAKDSRDLEEKLKELKGVGDVTVNIFLREMRGIWEKANPTLSPDARLAAERLGLLKKADDLKKIWRLCGATDTSVEVGLSIVGRKFCKKGRCPQCPVRSFCSFLKRGND